MTTWRHPHCEHGSCTKQAVLCFKLDPRNLRERRARLCDHHRRDLGYTKVDYQRPALYGTKVAGGRTRSDT